jgi:hypothetical protein
MLIPRTDLSTSRWARNDFPPESVDRRSDGFGLLVKWAPLLACCVLALSATGCNFSRTVTNVRFAPTVSQPLVGTPKAGLVVGEVKDSRALKESEKDVLAHKQTGGLVGGWKTSGGYVTQRPMADIVHDGLVDALKRSSFTDVTTKYELRGDIQQFGFYYGNFDEIITAHGARLVGVLGMEFYKAIACETMTVRFDLYDKTTEQSVWNGTYTGIGPNVDRGGIRSTALANMFAKATDDLVKQLVTDKAFRSFLE